jgi:hypothetical protein
VLLALCYDNDRCLLLIILRNAPACLQ